MCIDGLNLESLPSYLLNLSANHFFLRSGDNYCGARNYNSRRPRFHNDNEMQIVENFTMRTKVLGAARKASGKAAQHSGRRFLSTLYTLGAAVLPRTSCFLCPPGKPQLCLPEANSHEMDDPHGSPEPENDSRRTVLYEHYIIHGQKQFGR